VLGGTGWVDEREDFGKGRSGSAPSWSNGLLFEARYGARRCIRSRETVAIELGEKLVSNR